MKNSAFYGISLIFLSVVIAVISQDTIVLNPLQEKDDKDGKVERYPLLEFKWHEVQQPIVVVIWILLAAYGKTLFNYSSRVSEHLPDSALLIVMGLLIGGGLRLVYIAQGLSAHLPDFQLPAHVFFIYLLPPIVFDAGYSMPNRAFFANLTTILTYAVVGTLINVALIGVTLWGLAAIGAFTIELSFLNIMLFSSLICAVDPVAVLVVFEEVQVNEVLYIAVFGESLLNDAVTVVLYNIFSGLCGIGAENVEAEDIITGVVSFFIVSFGGVIIGVLFAFVVAFTTRWTENVALLNPLFVFIIPYFAYLVAELAGVSAILAIVFCGIIMKQYIKMNIGENAQVTIKYLVKAASNSAEAVIFMFLGLSIAGSTMLWDTWFILTTLVACLLYRAVGVLAQTFVLNKYRLSTFSLVEQVLYLTVFWLLYQFIMSYGGLRGAVAYGLAVSLKEEIVGSDEKHLFMTACEAVVLFTVFLQGMTIKPIVNWLNVEKADHRTKSMNENIFDRLCDRTMAGIEDLCAFKGDNWLRHQFDIYNTKYVKRILTGIDSSSEDMKIVQSFARLTATGHFARNASDLTAIRNGIALENGEVNVAYSKDGDDIFMPTINVNGNGHHIRFADIPSAPGSIIVVEENDEQLKEALARATSRRRNALDDPTQHGRRSNNSHHRRQSSISTVTSGRSSVISRYSRNRHYPPHRGASIATSGIDGHIRLDVAAAKANSLKPQGSPLTETEKHDAVKRSASLTTDRSSLKTVDDAPMPHHMPIARLLPKRHFPSNADDTVIHGYELHSIAEGDARLSTADIVRPSSTGSIHPSTATTPLSPSATPTTSSATTTPTTAVPIRKLSDYPDDNEVPEFTNLRVAPARNRQTQKLSDCVEIISEGDTSSAIVPPTPSMATSDVKFNLPPQED